MNKNTNIQAQILVITLLALVIISVIIVGVFNITTRDVRQTVANREYERLFNAAETKIFEVVDELGVNTNVQLSNLISPTSSSDLRNISSNCVTITPDKVDCNFVEGTTQIGLVVEDTSDIIDYELGKDDSLTLDLSGYRGDIQFRVSEAAALDFSLLYTNGGVPYVINDYFDISVPTVFDSNGGDPISDPANNHAYPFAPVGGTDYYRFTIGSIAGLPVTGSTQSLTITGRKNTQGLVLLDILGSAGFPNQVRRVTSVGFDSNTDTSVVARVVSQIPLAPQHLALFNYALLTPDVVSK